VAARSPFSHEPQETVFTYPRSLRFAGGAALFAFAVLSSAFLSFAEGPGYRQLPAVAALGVFGVLGTWLLWRYTGSVRCGPSSIVSSRPGGRSEIFWNEIAEISTDWHGNLVIRSRTAELVLDKALDGYLELYRLVKSKAPASALEAWNLPLAARGPSGPAVFLFGAAVFLGAEAAYLTGRGETAQALLYLCLIGALLSAAGGIFIRSLRYEFSAGEIRRSNLFSTEVYPVSELTDLRLEADADRRYGLKVSTLVRLRFDFRDGRGFRVDSNNISVPPEQLYDILLPHYNAALQSQRLKTTS